MTEETLSDALANLNDDNIDKAAIPEGRRAAVEEPQEESTFIDLTDEDVGEVAPISNDKVREDFDEGALGNDDQELSEAEKEAKKAQGRINQAVKQAKDWQRRELQALQYAKQLQEENKKLSSQMQLTSQTTADENLKISKSYKDEFEGRVDAQAKAAKNSVTKAYESGDPELMADAQQALARAESERTSLEQYKRELVKYEQDMEAWNNNQARQRQADEAQYQQQQQQPQQQQPQYSEPSSKAQGWAEKNEWFGVDKIMTSTAMVIHQELAESGIDLESNEYYSNLDNRLREELPNRFKAESNAGNNGRPVQTVVSGTRTTGNGRSQNDRRVELTPSEQALSKRLGVSFKDYAKQKMRLQAS
jgi:hypothetical protein|tara:strand:- start:6787 stop:7875 length:1089 start_codon:yes stop_codon:yes gene_type:complete